MFLTGPPGQEMVHSVKMLAEIGQWEGGSALYTDNTRVYLLLVLFKLLLDVAFTHLCCQKIFSTYYSLCDASIVLADMLLLLLLGLCWYRGDEDAPTSLCFILASASALFGALPLPVLVLGLLSSSLDALHPSHSALWRCGRSAGLVLLTWALAVYLTLGTVSGELMELNTPHATSQVCEVKESRVINHFVVVVFTVIVCAMLPFGLRIPRWLRKFQRLHVEREREPQQNNQLSSISSQEEEECVCSRPPLWLSLVLGFSTFWAPYLSVSVICVTLGFGVPAYIIVNVLWVECTNSLVLSLVFYAHSRSRGPYCNLPRNVCMWHICWYLSKGTAPQQNPIDVSTRSRQQKNTVHYV